MLKRVRKTVFNSLRPKNHFLAFLLCALILPSVAVILLAAFALVSQERAMEAAVRSYVQDLAESVAYRLGSNVRLWEFPLEYLRDATRYNIFSWGPSIPGWVAHIAAVPAPPPPPRATSVVKFLARGIHPVRFVRNQKISAGLYHPINLGKTLFKTVFITV